MDRKEILKLIQAKQLPIDKGVKLYDELVKNSIDKIPEHACIVLKSPGYVDDLSLSTARPKEPGNDEIQIEVRAFSLNFGDLLCVKGLYPTMPPYPFTPGFEVAGIATKVGKDVKRVKVGDPVISIMGPLMGGHSSIVTVSENWTVKKPDFLSFEEACSIPITFLTVYHAFEAVRIQQGEKILIQTAAGGTGLIAVQLAMNSGAEIYATAGSGEKLKYLHDMGVRNLINYREEDFYQKVMEMTDGRGVDIVLNTLSGEAIQKGINLLGSGGRYVEIAMTGLKSSNPINMAHMVDNQSFYSVDLRKFLIKNQGLATKYLDIMVEYLESGIVKPTICKVFKFSEIKQAYKCLEDRRNIGKIVVSVTGQPTSIERAKSSEKKPEKDYATDSSKTVDIAVIGMAARFPGSPDINTFWENLANGIDLITEIPKERWDWKDYYHPDSDNLEKTNCKYGSFIENADLFDSSFFKISGREAEVTDPQQRIFLEECWNALEDAGYASEALDSKRCGVFVGVGGGDYQSRLRQNNIDRIPQSFWGNEPSVIPARIAYFLNLKGAAVSINTACSSSLVAIHVACRSILAGDSDMALAGGVFVCTTPEFYILSSNANMLSPDGRCKAFDKSANGFVPGEGAGVIVLKCLDEALKDGDHIYGVIKGSSINQDGKTNGITAPSSLSQTSLMVSLYEKYGINPETISYVEAHGTGTELGDPIEVGALTNAFNKFTSRKNFCWLGSVKTNIGHTVSAAGIAGVIKVLLALKHGNLPPLLNFNELNEHISFEDTPFKVNTALEEWKSEAGKPRRAAVSSFGFSGTNAHVVIEESPKKENTPNLQIPYYFIPLSAKTEQALRQRVEDLYKWLKYIDCSEHIGNIAYTLLMRRAHFPLRIALVARDTKDLMKKLGGLRSDFSGTDVHGSIQSDKEYQHNQNLITHANNLLNEISLYNLNKNTISEKKYLEKLSLIKEFYVKGYPLDWARLYNGGSQKHVSMPTYPFQRVSYWVPPIGQVDDEAGKLSKSRKTFKTVEDILAYYSPQWIEKPLTDTGMSKKQEGVIWVFGMEEELYEALKNRCESLIRLIRVIPGNAFTQNGRDTYTINPENEEDYLKLVNKLKSSNDLPSDILYVWSGPWNLNQAGIIEEAFISDGLLEKFNALVYLAKAFMKAASGRTVNLTFICQGNTPCIYPLSHGLSAFFRTLYIENPIYRFHSIQVIDDISNEEFLDLSLSAVRADGAAGEEIAYRNGKRMIRKLVRHTQVSSTMGQAFRHRGVYWLVGGSGGIGRLLVQYLAEKFDAVVYMTGRSDEPEYIKDIKGKVVYIKADVSKAGAARSIYSRIISETGSLNGVMNLAGVINDKYLINKSVENMQEVLAPKCWGTYYLDEATANEGLDFFMVFSSLVSFTGNSGQADYSFASGFIDGFMDMRNILCSEGKRRGNSISINWPLWEDGGMKLTQQAEKNMSEVLGLRPLGTSQGIEALMNCSQAGLTQLLVIYGNCEKFEGVFDTDSHYKWAGVEPHREVNENVKHYETETLLKWAKDYLKGVFAGVLKITPDSFETNTAFEDLGMDSLIVKDMNSKMEGIFGTLPRTLLFECCNIKALAEYLVKNNASQVLKAFNTLEISSKIDSVKETSPLEEENLMNKQYAKHCDEDIAIIGMNGRFPQARDIYEFWENLKSGKDCITEIPGDRWDYRDYYHPDAELAEQGKMYCKWGGFIDNASSFDTLFFNIPPRKAELMDPQERLLLQTSWLAIEDGGYNPKELSKKYSVGVFIGATTYTYQLWGPSEWLKGNHVFPESAAWSMANRISYFYDFKGPSIPVDTACSSSLTAIHQACGSIKKGECEVALVGGVNIYLHPSKYIGLCQMHMLSQDGRCKSFAEGADGFVPGEGVAVVILKPLSRAIRDKDNIYAVIKGSSVNHGGRTNGYTVPNPDSQAELICRALDDGRVEPLSITAIEAHGTGTALGDPIEIRGLSKAFAGSPKSCCAISSSKSNIGHLESAAGIVGLIKMALQLKYKQLVPTLHIKELNKDIQLEGSPFYIQKELTEWKKTVSNTGSGNFTYPRRGGISSFGAGGSNAHVILEEYDSVQVCKKVGNSSETHLIVLSAKTTENLDEMCNRLCFYLEERTGLRQDRTGGAKGFCEAVNIMAAEILGVKPEDILSGELFEDIGLDAVNMSILLGKINSAYNTDIKIDTMMKYKCLSDFEEDIYTKYLSAASPDREDVLSLGSIAYTLQTGRQHMEERVALVVSSIEELISMLRSYTSGQADIAHIYRGNIFNSAPETGDSYIRSLIKNKDYYALAALWVSGADIDWETLNRDSERRRVSLPGYSFSIERYWIPVEDKKITVSDFEANPKYNGVPIKNESQAKEFKDTVEFSGDEFYIRDHVVAGKLVMPASAYLDVVCSSYTRFSPGKAYKMCNLLWMRPFIFEDGIQGNPCSKSMYITLKPGNGKIDYEVYSSNGEEVLIHHTGEIQEWDTSRMLPQRVIDIESIKARCQRTLNGWECYNILENGGISYGQSLCVIHEIHSSGKEAVATLKLPPFLQDCGFDFTLHPSIIDGALQSIIGVDIGDGGGPYIPFSIGEINILKPLEDTVYTYISVSDSGNMSGSRLKKIDMIIANTAGEILIDIKNIALREVKPPEGKNDSVDTVFLENTWVHKELAANMARSHAQRETLLVVNAPEKLYGIESFNNIFFPAKTASEGVSNLDRDEDIFRFLESLKEQGNYPEKIVIFAPEVREVLDMTGAMIENTYYFIQKFTRSLMQFKADKEIRLLYIYCASQKNIQPFYAGIGGFFKTLRREKPGFVCKTVGVESYSQSSINIYMEFQADTDEYEILYTDGGRYVKELKEIGIEEAEQKINLRNGGTYLITGGMGALGSSFAHYLAYEIKSNLVLVGRTHLDDAKQEKIEQLERLGTKVVYIQADLSVLEEAKFVIQKAKELFGGIDGIIHCAGVIRDSFIMKKTRNEMEEVFKSKALSALNIDAVTQSEKLDFFIMFSSLAGVLGNPGQSDYAYSNCFIDAFSQYRENLRAEGMRWGKSISIQWPYWQDGGMPLSEEYIEGISEKTGMIPLPIKEGVKIFRNILDGRLHEIAVTYGYTRKIRETFGGHSQNRTEGMTMQLPKNNATNTQLIDKAQNLLMEILSAEIKLPVTRINAKDPLQKYGIDSLIIVKINREMEKYFGEMSKTLLFEYQTIEELAVYIVENYSDRVAKIFGYNSAADIDSRRIPESARRPNPAESIKTPVNTRVVSTSANEPDYTYEEIAIIGISGKYPMAADLDSLWENMKAGRDCITEIPKARWDYEKYFDPSKNKKGKTNSKWGGFIDDVDAFDPLFFNITPGEAEWMDPQERLFMETVWHTVEDAGYTRQSLKNDSIGVFVGLMYAQYNLFETEVEGTSMYPVGSYASIANRVSYFFNFRGPSIAVDTMCSSSLTTIHLACESIRRGECDAAVAGGVNVTIHPNKHLHLSMGGFAASDGRCRSFGNGGDGYVPGEGVGAVFLKPLSKAISDGDRIYGVIKSSFINHGGKTNGYTVPNPIAQTDLILNALKRAKWNPETISYVEAHGTGTSLGDPIEINSLAKAFGKYTNKKQFCSIGSIKSNIGHLESAAGIAAVSKVLLMMKHKQLVPSIHSDIINENINFSNSPFYVQSELQGWEPVTVYENEKDVSYRRRAAISAFGAGGANAHVLIEEYRPDSTEAEAFYDNSQPLLILLSARTKERLKEYAANLVRYVKARRSTIDKEYLTSVAYTLQVGREAMEQRLAMTVQSSDELSEKLEAFVNGNEMDGEIFVGSTLGEHSNVSILVDGEEGQQYLQSLISNKRFGKLAQLWTCGVDVDWKALHGSVHSPIVSLPGYPFAKGRYWIQSPDKNRMLKSGINSKLHPLVHTNTSTLRKQNFSSNFTGNEFFLEDHIVGGQKVLPGVVQLEMARVAGELAGEERVGGLRDVIWTSPSIYSGNLMTIQTGISINSGKVLFEISSGESGQHNAISQGELIFNEEFEVPARIEIDKIRSRCFETLSSGKAYEMFDGMGLNYGPKMRAVNEVYYNENEALSLLVLPNIGQYSEAEIQYHPAMMDGAFQTIAGLLLDERDNDSLMYLPFSVGRVEFIKSLTPRCYAYVAKKNNGSPQEVCFDIQITDTEGEVLMVFKNLQLKPSGSGEQLMYFHREWQREELSAGSGGMLPDSRTMVFDISGGLNGILRNGIPDDSQGLPIHVTNGERYLKLGDREYQMDFSNPTDYSVLLADLKKSGKNIENIVYFNVESSLPILNEEHINSELNKNLLNQLHLLKALAIESSNRIGFLYVYGSSESLTKVFQTGVRGFAQVVRLEHTNILYKTLGVDQSYSNEQVLRTIVNELKYTGQGAVNISYSGGSRFVETIREAGAPVSRLENMSFKQNGVYWITGGLGALGRIIAHYLVKKFSARLILTGRSDLTADTQIKIDELLKSGAEIVYYKGDISNKKSVDDIYGYIKRRFGKLDGIIHTAGITSDSLIINKDIARAREVLAPKVLGTINLDEVTKDEKLDVFVLFSSVGGVFGNYGQADYAYANVFIDDFARYRESLRERKERKGRTVSVVWPFWKEGEMKVSENVLMTTRQEIGLHPLSTDNGIKALEYGLSQDKDHIIVVQGNGALLKKKLDNVYRYTQQHTNSEVKPVSAADSDSVKLFLKKIIIEETKLSNADIKPDEVWTNFGIDSTVNLRLVASLERHFGVLPKTLFFEYTTLNSMTEYFKQYHNAKLEELCSAPKGFRSADINILSNDVMGQVTAASQMSGTDSLHNVYENNRFTNYKIESKTEDKELPDGIAIIGVSGRYPKSSNLEEFWQNLKNGEDCITEIPKDRWDYSQYFDSQKGKPGKSYSKWGGFIDQADRFDPLFFKISPREAASMDPQQRVFMETAWHTLEDAGYPAECLKGKSLGVFVGVMYGQYQLFGSEDTVRDNGVVLDSSYASVANRVSYFFDFRGPSIAVDTMCSSSLTSIHLACQSIRMGECEMALAGGVNLTIHPSKYVNLSQGKFVSSEGLCRSFGIGGDGYVPGEGVGAVLLKPLKKAVADEDIIYAVIRGSSVNHGGKSSGYTVPNPTAQAEVIDMGLKLAGWNPETIGYLEAHGTGTSLGDPVEMKGLLGVFGTPNSGRKCPIGSVKSNIGHLESAAGIAGLTKVILMMKNKTLVKSLHSETLNPYIDFDNMPFYVQRNTEKWERHCKELPLRAGVSSFGAGGSNAHLLVEAYDEKLHEDKYEYSKKQIVIISAKTWESVKAYAGTLAAFLSKEMLRKNHDSKTLLSNVAFTLQTGREEMENRLAIVVEDMEQLVEKLTLFKKGIADIQGVYAGTHPGDSEDIQSTINSVIYDEESIASRWVSGGRIDWRSLHQGYAPRHISLPGYAFERKRYWFDTFTSQPQAESPVVLKTKPTGLLLKDFTEIDDDQPKKTHEDKVVLKKILNKEVALRKESDLPTAQTEITVTLPEKKSVEEIMEVKPAVVYPDIRREIENAMMDVLYLSKDDIDPTKDFMDLGMDSVLAIEFAKRLSKAFLIEIKTIDLYEYKTVESLAAKLQTMLEGLKDNTAGTLLPHGEDCAEAVNNGDTVPGDLYKTIGNTAHVSETKTGKLPDTHKQEDIAVIGISGRYPMAENINSFWEILKQGKNCIGEIPGERWDYRTYFDTDRQKTNKIPSKWGGFIKDIDKFDPLLFNISPREAEILDPQVRIMLELAWEALEDAGYSRSELQRNDELGQKPKVGVFVGSMYLQYPWVSGDTDMGSLLSNSSYWSIANRISYFFNFKGPSMSVDTACSSSMTAIHLACESIRNGECSVALAGGVNLSLIPNKYMGISQMGMLSSKAESRGLGDSDGYVPGEGAGAVILKPVSKAVIDRDHIYAVIKGSGISHSGQTEGFTSPDSDAQAALITETLEKSGINPRTISCMELSTTGSPAGDAAEFEGICKAFRRYTMDRGFCSIGTVKSNIGHIEASSGIAQLTKVVLQLWKRQLVPTINWQPLNPNIRLDGSPFYIQKDLQPWNQGCMGINGERVEYPLRASINSFGAGGSNSHLIMEEYQMPVTPAKKNSQVLIVLSARKKETLNELVTRMRDFFAESRNISLDDVAFTLQVGREAMEERLAIITDGWDDLLHKLNGILDGRDETENVFRSSVKLGGKEHTFIESTLYAVEMIQERVRQGALHKIAELWIKGVSIDWNLMPQNKDCRRLPLPKYPFEKKSYWLKRENTEVQVKDNNDTNAVISRLKTILSELINLPVGEIDEDTALKRYGLDSLHGMRLINRIREMFGIDIPVSKFLTLTTLRDITQFINDSIKIESNANEDISDLLDRLEAGELTPYEAISKK
ncbi:MAG: SDR family NAD(P)-dependent oxidoreductase [Clostridia bacterium]|nr:SDR family NAD(P)-dependent oxidoreductase [Clostridia bacterium]